jgi:hypothetical protein
VIAEVDGTDVAAAAMDDIIARLRGSAGSSVTITVQRGRRHLVGRRGAASAWWCRRAAARWRSRRWARRAGARC